MTWQKCALLLLTVAWWSTTTAAAAAVREEATSADEEHHGTPLSQEPMLKDLFFDEPSRLTKLTSCLDSVFKLNQAYEVLFSLKSIYNDHLSNKTNKLTDSEQRLLHFCRDPLQAGGGGAYFQHPVNAHKFVIFAARVMNPQLRDLINENPSVKILLRHLVSNAECWLNEASVTESTQSLLSLKAFYNISVGDFAIGNFHGHLPEVAFTARELFHFLLHLNRQYDPAEVAELAEYLRRERKEEMQKLGEQPVRSLYRVLGKAYYQMKQFDKASEVLREYKSERDPAPDSLRSIDGDLRYIEANRRGEPNDFEEEARRALTNLERDFGIEATPNEREDFQRYRRLCNNGTAPGAAANLSSNPLLICENWRPYNGWYAIRKEILSSAPMVVYYHGVFTETNITNDLMQEAEKRIFETPQEEDEAGKDNRLTRVRLHSFSKPMPALNSNITRSVIQRLEFVTQLDVSVHFASSEKYIEVANHGHGIRNTPQATEQRPNWFLDGLATALFFPVEQVDGGELLFPTLNVRIPIKRSDLVVWYNYLPTYHVDRSSVQQSCPILYGDKWTARATLGLTRCSVDQEMMMEPWLPGVTMQRRRSVARNWTALVRPKPPPVVKGNDSDANNATSANATLTEPLPANATKSEVTNSTTDQNLPANSIAETPADSDAESTGIESNKIDANNAESNEVESTDAESNEVESNDAESNEVESKDAESNEVESKDAESNEVESTDAESNVEEGPTQQ